MISIGKTAKLEAELTTLLQSAHTIYMRVRMLDLDHRFLRDLSTVFIDGQVTVDSDAEVTRALDITFFDPDRRISIDPDDPSRTAVYLTDMISVVYIVMNPDRTKTWEIPVFCGPVDAVNRDDIWLDVKCLGKESLSMANLWRGRNFKKGQAKTWVIKEILRDMVGETKMDIPDLKAKMPTELKLGADDKPWIVCKRLAASLGYQLFYDGRGVAVMRKRQSRPSFTLNERWLTSEPKLAYDLKTTINAVAVIGAKPKKAKKRVQYTAVAAKSHPLSPWRLGRGGVPRYLPMRIEDDGLRSIKECKNVAMQNLAAGLLAGTDVSANGIPHARLQELDVVAIRTSQVSANAVMRKFTIPLVAGDDASYGYLRKTKPRGGARGVRVRKRGSRNNNKTGLRT